MMTLQLKYPLDLMLTSVWRRVFNKCGMEALKSHQKGRKSKVKHDKKKLRHLVNKNKLDQLREELAKKNQELYDRKLENDI